MREYVVSAHESLSELIVGNRLNLPALLDKYRDYVQRRGFRAFDTEKLKEGAWHYALDGFIHFFIQQIHTWIIRTDFERASRYWKQAGTG